MIISEYIKALKGLMKEHGDLPVTKFYPDGSVNITVNPPQVGYTRKLTPRQYKVRYWDTQFGEELKGKKIIRL